MSNKKHQIIQNRINKLREKQNTFPKRENTNLAFNIAIEMLASAIVGVIVGIIFDNLFDSKPACLIICIVISFIAFFKSIWLKYVKNDDA